jgi:hypothetical protein
MRVADEARSGLVWKSRFEQQASVMETLKEAAADAQLASEGARARRNRIEEDLREARALVKRLLDKSEGDDRLIAALREEREQGKEYAAAAPCSRAFSGEQLSAPFL